MMKGLKCSPSALFLMTFVVALTLSWFLPWYVSGFMDGGMMRYTGVFFLLVGFVFNTLAYREFKRSLTPYAPFSTPKVLLKQGVFSWSRNPVYLALVLSEFGLGFVFDSVWLLLGSLVLLTVLHLLVIAGEEKILEQTFKEDFGDYKRRTRPWL